MSIDTETATANWRKSCPLMPGMNATGTNTESNESNGENRTSNFGHGLLARLGNRKFGFFLNHPFNVLDNDNGIIDDDPDGEHKRKQRDRVGRVSNEKQYGKCPDNGYRYGDQRDERRSQFATKQEENDRHKNNGNH